MDVKFERSSILTFEKFESWKFLNPFLWWVNNILTKNVFLFYKKYLLETEVYKTYHCETWIDCSNLPLAILENVNMSTFTCPIKNCAFFSSTKHEAEVHWSAFHARPFDGFVRSQRNRFRRQRVRFSRGLAASKRTIEIHAQKKVAQTNNNNKDDHRYEIENTDREICIFCKTNKNAAASPKSGNCSSSTFNLCQLFSSLRERLSEREFNKFLSVLKTNISALEKFLRENSIFGTIRQTFHSIFDKRTLQYEFKPNVVHYSNGLTSTVYKECPIEVLKE